MAHLVGRAGLSGEIEIESAGTGGWHVGNPPDERATAAAAARGIATRGVAQQVTPADFERFDLLVAMDEDNRLGLLELARRTPDPLAAAQRVRKLREFDPSSAGAPDLDVPDPYYGGADGFDHVLDLVEAACAGLLDELRPAGRYA